MAQGPQKDFFISYTSADRTWAEWIAWQLEAEGFSTVIQAWDFRPGSSFVMEMDKAAREAARTIAVLSPDYLNADYPKSEWAAAFKRDPTGEQGILLPVRVQKCEVEGLLGSIIYIDLVDLDEPGAREELLAGIPPARARPASAPQYPGGQSSQLQHVQFPGAFPPIWTVPYHRNPFFTGRDDLLKYLHDKLTVTKTAVLTQAQAISGLGGIGKTQAAVEYSYRYRGNYQAVLWFRAATRDTLILDFVTMAALLDLREKDEQDQNKVVAAVKRWLVRHREWLLILDNADDLALARDFLPTAGTGHIVLTTRAQAIGSIAEGIEVEKMSKEEGVLLLLRRARVLATGAAFDTATEIDRTTAETIVAAVDGLPLALDQAGAYIEETGCSVSDYLDRYRQRQIALLNRRGEAGNEHPEPVATTWSLSFEKVEQINAAAADLLRLCTFLSPDAIPEEVIVQGAPELGPLLQPIAADSSLLDEAIGALRRFSLVRRNRDTGTLTIHRLVQAVLKATMNDETQRRWARLSVQAVNRVFPAVEVETWPQCQRCLAQAQACADIIKQYGFAFPEAAELLNKAASYLHDHAQYTEAESLYKISMEIGEKVVELEHSDTAIKLHNLAMLYHEQGQYEKAEPLYLRALAISEKVLGPEHFDTAATLNNLSVLYRDQGQYKQAETVLKRAQAINEKALGPTHMHTTASLSNLAAFYQDQRQYEKAEPLLNRALTIREQVLGPDHPEMAKTLNNLAVLYYTQDRYEKAESLLKPAQAILERVLGVDHPYTTTVLKNYAELLRKMNREGEASMLEVRAKIHARQVPPQIVSLNTNTLVEKKVRVSVEKLPSSEAIIEVDFTWDDLEKASEKAYRKLARTVDVPGFRRGKVPRSLLERKLGKEYVYQEGLDDLITETYRSAVKEHDLIPIAQPELDAPELKMGQPYHFSLKVPILSPVTLGDYRSLHFDLEEATVTAEEVEQEIESLRSRQATWQVVARPAEIGDRVTADLMLTLEGQIISDLKDNPFELTVERYGLFSGMDKHIVGMQAGEARSFTTKIPGDYSNEKLAGKEASYEVILHVVEAKELPELDDAFAIEVSNGEYQSLEMLRKALTNSLLEDKKGPMRDELREKVIDALIEQSQFTIHPLLVQEETEEMLNQLSHLLEEQHMSMDQYLLMLRKTRKEYLEDMLPDASQRLKRELVLDEVARREEISVTPEEIEALFNIYAQAGQRLQRSEEQIRALTLSLRREKTITHLSELTTRSKEEAESFKETANVIRVQAAPDQNKLLLSLLRRGSQQHAL